MNNNKNNVAFSNNSLRKLKNVDEEIGRLFSKVSMSTIINPITIDILKNFKKKKVKQQVKPSIEFIAKIKNFILDY